MGLAVGIGAGVGGSVGISVSINDVDDPVSAYINNSTVTATNGDVTVQAIENGSISAWTIGGAVGGGAGGGAGIGIGAAGAGSGNTVTNTVQAYIEGDSSVTTTKSGDVIVSASDTSGIQAIAGGLGIGLGVGTVGGGGSLGVAAANNYISNDVYAFVDGSTVNAMGGVSVTATEKATIFTITVGGALAVGVGGVTGVGVAVAGSASTNTIKNDVEAYVHDGGSVSANGGDLSIKAEDTSNITAGGGGLAVGAGSGTTGVGAAVGFAAAKNDVENKVRADVEGSTASATGHDVAVSATETPTLVAITAAGAVAVGVGVASGAITAGGGNATNIVGNKVRRSLRELRRHDDDQWGCQPDGHGLAFPNRQDGGHERLARRRRRIPHLCHRRRDRLERRRRHCGSL